MGNSDRSHRPTVEVTPLTSNEIAERMRIAHDLHEGEKAEASIRIMKSAHELFEFWRDFSHLPLFMKNVERLEVLSPVRAHWVIRTLNETRYEWDAEIIAEIPDRMISWQTLPGSELNHAGSIWFRPVEDEKENATEIHVHFRFHAPTGERAISLSDIFGENPSKILKDDLCYLRDLMESGDSLRAKSEDVVH